MNDNFIKPHAKSPNFGNLSGSICQIGREWITIFNLSTPKQNLMENPHFRTLTQNETKKQLGVKFYNQ